jgi:hypothetical protein
MTETIEFSQVSTLGVNRSTLTRRIWKKVSSLSYSLIEVPMHDGSPTTSAEIARLIDAKLLNPKHNLFSSPASVYKVHLFEILSDERTKYTLSVHVTASGIPLRVIKSTVKRMLTSGSDLRRFFLSRKPLAQLDKEDGKLLAIELLHYSDDDNSLWSVAWRSLQRHKHEYYELKISKFIEKNDSLRSLFEIYPWLPYLLTEGKK